MHVNWNSPEIIMVLTSFIGNTTLIFLIITYNELIIKPHRLSPVFRVRRPLFCFLFMLCCVVSAILRCVISLCMIIYPFWDRQWYQLSARASFYFGIFTFSLVRMWLLYYDVNCVRKKQNHLLSKYLHLLPKHSKTKYSITFVHTPHKKKYMELESKSSSAHIADSKVHIADMTDIYGKYHHFYGSAKTIFFMVILFTVIILIITMLLDFEPGIKATQYTNFICKLVMFISWLFFGHLLLKMYATGRINRFSDDLNLLSELIGLWVLWFFAICIALILSILYKHNYIKYIDGPIALFMFLWQTVNVLMCMFIPFQLIHQSKKAKPLCLKQILSQNTSFFNFVAFSAQDSSIENVAFLVEVWQFKYQTEFKLKYKNSDYIWSECMDTDGDEEDEGDIVCGLGLGLELCDMTDIDDMDMGEYSFKYSPLPLFNQTSLAKKICSVQMLKSMPWSELPLNQSIWKHRSDKSLQCQIIYNKFIARKAPFALNISHCGLSQTKQSFEKCMGVNNKDVIIDEAKILNVFDNIIPEIFDNLDNVSLRFNEQ